jgi:alkylation response protein AidB-like acyl-CoA dehydrogenase
MNTPAYGTLNFGLGETADMLRDTVREFAAAEIAPRAAEIDQANAFRRISGANLERWVCSV